MRIQLISNIHEYSMRFWIALLALLPLCLTSSLWAAPAAIVKVDQPVTLGSLKSWPAITAEQRMVGPNGESARFFACYDAANLYLLVRVQDQSPLKNSAFDPAMIIKGGDAVGICFASPDGAQQRIVAGRVDGKPLAVCFRPVSTEKRPYSFASPVSTYVMDYVAPIPQVQVACSTIEGGYAMGVSIPWGVLGHKPAAGLEFPFDAQVIFSDPAGTKNIATAWWHSRGNGPACTVDLPSEAHLYPDLWGTARLFASDPGPQVQTDAPPSATVTDPEGLQPVPITFTLPRACRVSLVIADAKGGIVAEPLRAEAMSAGKHTITWNGRGYRDMPLPAGQYTWRLAYFDGVRSFFYGAAGNSGRPPFPSADKKGSIGGIHLGPSAVAADAGGIYLLHAGEEGEHGLRKVTASGDVLWTHSIGNYAPASAVTAEGTRAYMISGFPEIMLICMDAATGRDLPMGKEQHILLGDFKKGFAALAVAGGKAYISVTTEDKLKVIDVGTGKADADLPLAKPGRLCRQDDNHLLAISGDTVVRIDLTTRVVTPQLTGLTAPSALTLDKAGRLYVAELGNKQQITQFKLDGTRLVSYGKPGGRALTVPKYDPLEFRNINDLAFDAQGQLWFVEAGSTAPRRIGCLSADGKWVRDYCGPVYCSSGMVVDLDDASSVYYHLGASWIKARIKYAPSHSWRDYDWQIESIFYLSQSGSDEKLTPDLMIGSSSPSFAAGITFTGANGKRYFWIDGENTYTRGAPAALWVWDKNRWMPAGLQAVAGKPFWADRNGDGRVQADEYSLKPSPDGGWRWLGRDLTLYGRRGAWKPARIDARGVPDYDGGVYTPYATAPYPAWFTELLDNGEVAASRPGSDGAVYYLANIGNGQGRAFWDRASENKLVKVKNGQVQWWIGHHDATNGTNGDLTFTYNICGIEDGVIVVSDVANQYVAYTEDGLTLGWLLTDDAGRPRWSDESYVSAESFSGQFIKDPTTGKYLLFCGASESCQVREVTGISPQEITRLAGELTLVSSMPRSTPSRRATSIPYVTWECSNGRFNGIDGQDWEWWPRDYDAVTIRDGKQVVGDVRFRRDAGYLHVFADVLQPSGFHAGSASAPADLSGKADGVELILGPLDPADRRAPKAGDTRVILTAHRDAQGRLVGEALFKRPASAPLPPSPLLRPMTNWGSLDAAPPQQPLDAAGSFLSVPGARVTVTGRPDGYGYRLEAEIPLALFPELANLKPVTFNRWTGDNNHQIKRYTEERYDLTAPLRLNVAILATDAAGAPRRLPWQPDDPKTMDPSAWGTANAAVTLAWAPQSGAREYHVYRALTPELTAARLVQSISQGTQVSDMPGIGTFYYWLTAADALGESQFLGPQTVTVGGQDAVEPRVVFSGQPMPPILFPNLPDLFLFPGTATALNVTITTKTLTPRVTPAGAKVTTEAMGPGLWRVIVAIPADAKPGSHHTVTLTGAGAAKPVIATFKLTANPVGVAGIRTQTGGILTLDTRAPAGQPVTTVPWAEEGSLSTVQLGRRGYVLMRRNGSTDAIPTRIIRAPFTDTFTAGDGFWYGDSDGNMQFDLLLPDGTRQVGRDKEDHVRFGSVNSNAGTPLKPETYPGASWTITVTDAVPHLLTVFTPAKGNYGAKERFVLRSASGDCPPATVELDGTQGGAIIQFRFIGSATLEVRQTAGGMGSSNPGANCAAIFLD